MEFSSKILAQAVDAFATLPGIGKKSALRLALFLAQQDKLRVSEFLAALTSLNEQLQRCERCHNLADTPVCHICSDHYRDQSVLCVVESIKDVMAIETTGQYRGLYHILGGLISPLEGISPEQLNIASLLQRLEDGSVRELIMALSPNIEGDTTIYYIHKKIPHGTVKITTLARGISFGGELQYADEVTLGRSIVARIPYQQVL